MVRVRSRWKPTPTSRVPRAVPRSVRAAVLALALAAAACGEDQDPGLDPGGDEPATTSNTLGQCPPGGPDATTPDAGCVGEDGRILRN